MRSYQLLIPVLFLLAGCCDMIHCDSCEDDCEMAHPDNVQDYLHCVKICKSGQGS